MRLMPVSATSLPPDQRPDVVLHIGMGKTGTTSIQASLRRHSEVLAEHGVLYPESLGNRRHLWLGMAVQPEPDRPRDTLEWRRQGYTCPSELRPVMEERLLSELTERGLPTVLFSDEALHGAKDGGIRNLRELMDRIARSVRVVSYLRRQDDHLCSRYQQVVRYAGERRRLADKVGATDFSHTYDYHARMVAWRDLMRPDELVVRVFERAALSGGSLHQDFVEATGLGIRPAELEGPTRNESLDAESVEFLRLLNVLWPHGRRPEVPGLLPPNRMFHRLKDHSTGPTLTLPEDRLDEFMARWEESNRAVARDFAPHAPRTLFSTERKSRDTTTEQRLDPARLDHFLEVSRLPEALHAPLRKIVEREALGFDQRP